MKRFLRVTAPPRQSGYLFIILLTIIIMKTSDKLVILLIIVDVFFGLFSFLNRILRLGFNPDFFNIPFYIILLIILIWVITKQNKKESLKEAYHSKFNYLYIIIVFVIGGFILIGGALFFLFNSPIMNQYLIFFVLILFILALVCFVMALLYHREYSKRYKTEPTQQVQQ